MGGEFQLARPNNRRALAYSPPVPTPATMPLCHYYYCKLIVTMFTVKGMKAVSRSWVLNPCCCLDGTGIILIITSDFLLRSTGSKPCAIHFQNLPLFLLLSETPSTHHYKQITAVIPYNSCLVSYANRCIVMQINIYSYSGQYRIILRS